MLSIYVIEYRIMQVFFTMNLSTKYTKALGYRFALLHSQNSIKISFVIGAESLFVILSEHIFSVCFDILGEIKV